MHSAFHLFYCYFLIGLVPSRPHFASRALSVFLELCYQPRVFRILDQHGRSRWVRYLNVLSTSEHDLCFTFCQIWLHLYSPHSCWGCWRSEVPNSFALEQPLFAQEPPFSRRSVSFHLLGFQWFYSVLWFIYHSKVPWEQFRSNVITWSVLYFQWISDISELDVITWNLDIRSPKQIK